MARQETTIQINKKVKTELETLKLYPRESYNAVIERLITLGHDDGELSDETMQHIQQSLNEIKAGKFVSFEQVKEKAGL